jgi:hypothetical protein
MSHVLSWLLPLCVCFVRARLRVPNTIQQASVALLVRTVTMHCFLRGHFECLTAMVLDMITRDDAAYTGQSVHIHQVDSFGRTAFHFAAGHANSVNLLIGTDVDVNKA